MEGTYEEMKRLGSLEDDEFEVLQTSDFGVHGN